MEFICCTPSQNANQDTCGICLQAVVGVEGTYIIAIYQIFPNAENFSGVGYFKK